MTSKRKQAIIARDAFELADVLGLSAEDAITMEFRARLNRKIVELAKSSGVTHAELAMRSRASRTRITAILNGQTIGVSTDFLLRVLHALGCRTLPAFTRIKSAA